MPAKFKLPQTSAIKGLFALVVFTLLMLATPISNRQNVYAVPNCTLLGTTSVTAGGGFRVDIDDLPSNHQITIQMGSGDRISIGSVSGDMFDGRGRGYGRVPSDTPPGDYVVRVGATTECQVAGHIGGTLAITAQDPNEGYGIGANPCTPTECPTALGPISTTVKGLADKILQIGIGVAGGIALILMVVGAIRVLVSGGDQQKLNGGREMLIAAIAGLLFLIFSTLILQFIGLNILKGVPGIGS